MDCGILPNRTIGPSKFGAQYWQFQPSLDKHATCIETTYLRPDIAGSILPWPYTMAWLLIHIPLVLVRVARWEKVQALSLFLAAVGIAFTIQTYSSTQRKPEEILVWTPLTIILDIGAVMQLIFLVVESAKGESVNGFVPLWGAFTELMAGMFGRGRERGRGSLGSNAHAVEESKNQTTAVHVDNVDSRPRTPNANANTAAAAAPAVQPTNPIINRRSSDKRLRGKALIVIFSALLFTGLITLQIMGLVSAIEGLASRGEGLTSSWCSPMFQSFAIAVADGNCVVHDVTASASRGIGCITLSGAQQAGWLAGTVVALAVSLALELVDLLVLALVESHARWRQVKMRRPWCTMFCGVVILIFYVIYGVLNASRLPSGMTELVWVFRKEPSLGIATVCRGTVTAAGIRGSMMGWTDGFLSSWGRVYFG